MSGGDNDNDHDEHSPPKFYDDQPGSEVVDDGEDEAVEVLEYAPPDDVPLDLLRRRRRSMRKQNGCSIEERST